MEGHFGDRPIPGWKPTVKRKTVHPERMGKKPQHTKKKISKRELKDVFDTIAEDERKEMIRQSWALKHRDPID